jgi:hypothetical protein
VLRLSTGFAPTFAGTRNAWSYVVDNAGANSGWVGLGAVNLN